jgi:hypothetical protein
MRFAMGPKCSSVKGPHVLRAQDLEAQRDAIEDNHLNQDYPLGGISYKTCRLQSRLAFTAALP